MELCNLSPEVSCDGKSIVPLLRDPDSPWDTPALMTYMRGNHAVRAIGWVVHVAVADDALRTQRGHSE